MWDIKSKFGQNTCPTMKIFTQTVRNVNKLLYFFPFIKKLVKFFSYLILKFSA